LSSHGTTDPASLRAFIGELLTEIGPYVAGEFGRTGPLRFKVGREAITHVDEEAERRLVARILDRYPDHAIEGEEGGLQGNPASAWVWHLDPIDGTLNYSIGIPLFSMSVGVMRGEELVAGGVMDPLRNELFTAGRGEGAWLGADRIEVTDRSGLRQAIVSTQSSRHGRFIRDAQMLKALQVETLKNRRLGSIALELAYVAAGRFDLLLAGKNVPQNLYDVAAGILLVEEAGGRVSDADGRPFGPGSFDLVASNGQVHDEVLEFVRRFPDSIHPDQR
jgi:myo-inositol-1(or 4)-monophosphatase